MRNSKTNIYDTCNTLDEKSLLRVNNIIYVIIVHIIYSEGFETDILHAKKTSFLVQYY